MFEVNHNLPDTEPIWRTMLWTGGLEVKGHVIAAHGGGMKVNQLSQHRVVGDEQQ